MAIIHLFLLAKINKFLQIVITQRRENILYIFSMESHPFKKKVGEKQKDMRWKLVSKTDVMLLSGVIYPYVSEIFYTTHKTLSNYNFVNKSTNFILTEKSLYLFIYLRKRAINTISKIKLILSSKKKIRRFYLISI